MPAVLPLTRADVEKYAGQWVVVDDDKVIFASPTADAAFRWAAEHKLDPERTIVLAVPGLASGGWFF